MRIVLCIVVAGMFYFPRTVHAYTDLLDYFIDRGAAIKRGGVVAINQPPEQMDLRAPFSLDTQGKKRLDTSYEYLRTYRSFSGRWSGSHAYAEEFSTVGAVPFAAFDEKLSGSLAGGYRHDWRDWQAMNVQEKIDVKETRDINSFGAGAYLNYGKLAKSGVSLLKVPYQDSPQVPIELEISPVEYVSFGYRHWYRNIDWNVQIHLSGRDGQIPVRYAEQNDDLYLVGRYKELLYGKLTVDAHERGNRSVEGKLTLPDTLYLTGGYDRRESTFDQPFFVANQPGGYLRGTFKHEGYRVGVGAALSPRWSAEFNYLHKTLDSVGGGIASSAAVVDFWPSLLVGNYNHLYAAQVKTDQYHATVSYVGERWSGDLGLQYIDIWPMARLDYWRSVLFGLGQTGADSLELDTDRIQLMFLGLGLGYTFDNFKVGYSMGQMIPIGAHERTAEQSGGGGSGGGSDSASDYWDNVVKFFDRNPGGLIHRLTVSIIF